ncbi:MAG: hypothetical protein RLZ25_906 [Pseudomonadota bacterium]|jgi:hypothetical protein
MKNYWKAFLTTTTMILFAPAAQADGPRNGKWEVTAKSEMTGIPANMPATNVTICIDKASTEAGKPPIIADKSCTFSDYKAANGEASWKMQCSGQMQMKGVGHIKFSDNEYSGSSEMEMNMDGDEPMKMKQTFSGKRLGDC